MTQVATGVSPATPLDGVVVAIGANEYRFSIRDNEIWVEFPDPDTPGAPLIERQILMTTGSHHFQLYWYSFDEEDRSLLMLEAVYVIDTDEWMSLDSIFLKPPHIPLAGVNGLWNGTCILCHTTRGVPKVEPDKGFYSEVTEFGIACESCHGPGERHVRARQLPPSRYALHWSDDPDTTIVNPRHLEPYRQALVCGQCHAVFDSKGSEEFAQWRKSGTTFEAGDAELPLRNVSYSGEEHFWSDGLVRVTGREYNDLMVSPCFTHQDAERGIMSCLSCHSMHQAADDDRQLKSWANRQLKPAMDGREACIQCHGRFDDATETEAHTHHPPTSAASDCVNCHMPHTTWGQQRAIRSHAITSPNVATSLETGRPDACSLCHLDRTYVWTAGHLKEWYKHEIPRFSKEERKVAVGPLMAMRGDAGQRALMAWAFGWPEAQSTAGSSWMPPYLSLLMRDPYAVVRLRARLSLKTIDGYENLDFRADSNEREVMEVVATVKEIWEASTVRDGVGNIPRLLISDSSLDFAGVQHLMRRRDNRPMYLQE